MAISSYFFNAIESGGVYDRVYDSEDVTSYLDKIVGNGVFPNPSTNLQVLAGTGMVVNVQPGQGWINGHKMISDATTPLTISAANALLTRIDRIIFYVDFTARDMGIALKTGTAAATPTAPDLVRTTSRYEMCLANITVGPGVTSITQANITDTRQDSSVCGYVQGLVQQIDTTTLWNQYDAAFEDWFTQVKETLATATMLRKLEQIFTTTSATVTSFTVTDYIPSYKYSIDILEIYVNGLRLNESDFTQSQATVTLATPITHAGAEVELVVYKSIDGSDAETIVEQVQDIQDVVDLLEARMFVATGTNDLQKLSQMVSNFLSGGNDYKQLEIDVYGDLACTLPSGINPTTNAAVWLAFRSQSATTRRVRVNFANASRLVIDASGYAASTLFDTTNADVEILNGQFAMSNAASGGLFTDTSAPTVHDCAFWVNGTGGGSLVGAYQGTFINSRFSCTNGSAACYGFSANGNVLRLEGCEVLAYNASAASAESVAVQVQANQTNNVLMMTNCKCPITARGGYKQSNAVKVNSGKFCLVGNLLGMAAALYNTGSGMTETGTMIG